MKDRRNIAEIIFLNSLSTMKSVLDLAEYRHVNDKKGFLYFKKEIMNYFYTNLKQTFTALESLNIVTRCKCESNLRHGYTECPDCHGAGYVNASEN